VRPDVVAPGRWIAGPLAAASSGLAAQYPERVIDTDYLWMSGTSMAAPVVAGVAALVFQAHPEYTNDAVKWLLMNTATGLSAAGSGAGEVDADAALGHSGALGVANNGIPISQLLTGPDGATTYTTSSWTTSSWTTSSWTTSSWTTSSWTTSSWTATTPQVAPWTHVDVE
jgi:serine protease AprX